MMAFLELNSDVKIDLLIIGSVAVSRNGLRIGKGRGYTDLEFAIMQHVRALNEDALIVTMVHECQVCQIHLFILLVVYFLCNAYLFYV